MAMTGHEDPSLAHLRGRRPRARVSLPAAPGERPVGRPVDRPAGLGGPGDATGPAPADRAGTPLPPAGGHGEVWGDSRTDTWAAPGGHPTYAGGASQPSPGRSESPSGARAALLGVALVALLLVIIDTTVGVLPQRALVSGLPVLSVLSIQRVVVLAGLLALLIASPRPSTFRTVVDIPLLALLALAVWSVFSAGQEQAPLRGLATAVGVFYLAVGVLRRHPDAVPAVLVTVLAAAFVTAGTAVEQWLDPSVDTGFCRDGLRNVNECGDGTTSRAIGTFTNPNILGGYLVGALPLASALLWTRAPRRLRVPFGVLAGIGAAGLVVSFSRGAVAGLVIAGAVAVTAVLLARRGRVRSVPALVVAAMSAVALLLVATAVTGVLGRVSGRAALWATGLDAARQGGVDGVGYGRAGAVMSALSGVDYAHAHDLWLNWLIDVGPLGPVLITAVIVLAVLAGTRRAADGSALAGGAVTGLGALVLASVVDHPTTVSSVFLLLMLVVAAAVAGPRPLPGGAGRHQGATRQSWDQAGYPPVAGTTGDVPPGAQDPTGAYAPYSPDPYRRETYPPDAAPDPYAPRPYAPEPQAHGHATDATAGSGPVATRGLGGDVQEHMQEDVQEDVHGDTSEVDREDVPGRDVDRPVGATAASSPAAGNGPPTAGTAAPADDPETTSVLPRPVPPPAAGGPPEATTGPTSRRALRDRERHGR